jgi:hypothetical protein
VLTDLQARLHVPRPFRVLGLELRPFTLGHALTLDSLGLRHVADEHQLSVAVLICALPPGEWQRRLGSRWFAFRAWLWAAQVGLQLRWILWRQGPLAAAAVLQNALAVFRGYCAHHSACPEYRLTRDDATDEPAAGDDAAPRGAPFLESVLVTMLSKLHYPERDALALPLGTALMRYFIYWENEGRLELVNDEDAQLATDLSAEAAARHEETLAKANATLAAA